MFFFPKPFYCKIMSNLEKISKHSMNSCVPVTQIHQKIFTINEYCDILKSFTCLQGVSNSPRCAESSVCQFQLYFKTLFTQTERDSGTEIWIVNQRNHPGFLFLQKSSSPTVSDIQFWGSFLNCALCISGICQQSSPASS